MQRIIFSLTASTLVILGLTACGSADVADPEPDGEEEGTEEEEEEEVEAPEPAKPAGKVMPVAEINEKREANVGKMVTVSGFYRGTTKQGNPVEQINISITGSADGEGGKILCVGTPESEAMWEGFSVEDEIVVAGKVADRDWFGGALLEECVKSEADAGGGGGRGGKAKGGKSKGGKSKGGKGKRKAH